MAGENLACKYLKQHGWEIVDRNFHSQDGEIDIIAQRAKILAFVEVKTRAEDAMYTAQSAVTPDKQEKLRRTALNYLSQINTELQPRFDVCEVYVTKDRRVFIRYIENAFEDNEES